MWHHFCPVSLTPVWRHALFSSGITNLSLFKHCNMPSQGVPWRSDRDAEIRINYRVCVDQVMKWGCACMLKSLCSVKWYILTHTNQVMVDWHTWTFDGVRLEQFTKRVLFSISHRSRKKLSQRKVFKKWVVLICQLLSLSLNLEQERPRHKFIRFLIAEGQTKSYSYCTFTLSSLKTPQLLYLLWLAMTSYMFVPIYIAVMSKKWRKEPLSLLKLLRWFFTSVNET